MNYRSFLATVHAKLNPVLYIEIGVRNGHSLSLSRTRSYGIDPGFQVTQEINTDVRLFKSTSDEFFSRPDLNMLFERRADLSFIDGMHLFEFVLRDFCNCEAWSSPNGLIVIDDIFPRVPAEAKRERETNAWTGDVWKIIPTLGQHRPDLIGIRVDTQPTGLLLVCNLDPTNQSLKSLSEVHFAALELPDDLPPPDYVISRAGAVNPDKLLESGFLDAIAKRIPGEDLRPTFERLFPDTLIPGQFGLIKKKANSIVSFQ